MTLKKLLSQHGWLNIEAALSNEYPGKKNQLPAYEMVYYKLLLLPEADTDLQIEFRSILITNFNINYIDVCGRKQTLHVADAEISLYYSLNFTPWAEWLAMPVSLKTRQTFSEPEVIAHCLHTMTAISFEENNMNAAYEKLSESVEAVNLTVDKSQQQEISWEQLIQQLQKEE